jgi:MYXO-CTERM domain-containing protein
MSRRVLSVLVLVVLVGTFNINATLAGTYYVAYGGAGGETGADWGNAFDEVQDALDAIQTAVDTAPVVYIGKTTGAQSYDGAQKTFTFDFTADVELRGGVTVGTTTQSGVSAIRDTGETGLDLRQTGGTVGTPFNADFKVSNFDIETDRQALVGKTGGAYTITSYEVTNSTLSSTGTGYNTVYMDLANGIPMPGLTIDASTVTTAAGSDRAAIASHTANGGAITKVTITDSTVTASADGSATYKRGAIDTENRLFLDNATVTNTGAGWGAIAGIASAYVNGHEVVDSTITSDGNGLALDANDFSPGGVATKVENTTITAAGASGTGLRLAGWHGTGSDGTVTDVLISNSTVEATGTGGLGVDVSATNGGAMDIDVEGSTISGVDQAFYLHGGGGNRGNDTLDVSNSTLSAGTNPNSTLSVVEILSYRTMTMGMDQSIVQNGAGGINISPLSGSALLTMINSVVTDQEGAGYGVRLDVPTTGTERLTATNSTFSDLDGPALVMGDSTGSTIEAILNYVAFVPGGSGIVFENEDTGTALKLTGDRNAFYEYLTYLLNTGGGGLNDLLTNSLDFPASSALLQADGIHAQSGSPLNNQYSLLGGDPTVDIDDDGRPYLGLGDIGADEQPPPVAEPASLGLIGLALLGLKRRSRS